MELEQLNASIENYKSQIATLERERAGNFYLREAMGR